MNKYSSKAIKTAATVGMSLAMVLSNVAPVLADAPTSSMEAMADINAILNTLDKGIKNVAIDTEADWADTDSGMTLSAYVGEDNYKAFLEQAADILNNETAIHLVGKSSDSERKTITQKVDALENALRAVKTWGEGGENNFADRSEYDTAKSSYDDIVKYYNDYKGNLTSATATANKATYDAYFNSFESAIEEFQDSYVGDFVNDFLNDETNGLNNTVIFTGSITVKALLDGADFNRSNLSRLESFISDVKADKKTFGDNGIKYSTVQNDSEVADVIAALDEIVEEIKEVNELLKSTNTVQKEYRKVATKVNELATAAGNYDVDVEATVLAYENKVNAFRTADLEDLSDYVEEVVPNFYSVEVIKRTNGNYSLRLKKEAYARYLGNKTDVVSPNLEILLTTNLERDNEESVYDALVGNKTELEALVAAVTTDIEGITVTTNLTSAQASKIIAAKKALDSLYNTEERSFEEEYESALTTAEKRAIRSNATLIETLYLKLILNGTVTQSGWINNGNGNWDYIAEDGSRPTKWVASGANWYYVKNGTMLRNSWIASDAQGTRWYYVDDAGVMVSNTTVNGYTFNSYGVWVK